MMLFRHSQNKYSTQNTSLFSSPTLPDDYCGQTTQRSPNSLKTKSIFKLSRKIPQKHGIGPTNRPHSSKTFKFLLWEYLVSVRFFKPTSLDPFFHSSH